jgi:acetyl-CoA C-acetyltransferase
MTNEAYIFDAIRTPRGKGKASGALHPLAPIDLLATLLRALQARHNLDTAQVDDIVLGCVTPINEQGGDIARAAALYADWDVDTPGMQLNRFCGSGLEAVNLAAMKVRSGWEQLVVAGGVESMSRVTMGSDGGAWIDDPRVTAKTGYVPQGVSADLLATVEGFSRADVDQYGLRSQQLAAHARANGHFARSLVPVHGPDGQVLLEHDELIRPDTSLSGLANLPPAFAAMGAQGFDAVALGRYREIERLDHVHTAGNASAIADGAALVLIGGREQGAALGLKPRARIVSAALVGTEPTIMLTGPGPAAQRALALARREVSDIDLFEVNEAFAAVVLRFMRDLNLHDDERVNVNGGAIAMGHPLGATGAMLLGTALDELERRDRQTALVTLCIAGGMGIATIIERV